MIHFCCKCQLCWVGSPCTFSLEKDCDWKDLNPISTERIWDILLLVGVPRFPLASYCYIGISRDCFFLGGGPKKASMYTCLVNYWPVEQRKLIFFIASVPSKTQHKKHPASFYTSHQLGGKVTILLPRKLAVRTWKNNGTGREQWWEEDPFLLMPLFSQVLPVDFFGLESFS